MKLKLVCFTRKADGAPTHTVVLARGATPQNLIAIADSFLGLYKEHAAANRTDFVEFYCYLDGERLDSRALVEQVSTPFRVLREQTYEAAGFSLIKHVEEARLFLQQVNSKLPHVQQQAIWTGGAAAVQPDAGKPAKSDDSVVGGKPAFKAGEQVKVEAVPAIEDKPKKTRDFGLGKIGKPTGAATALQG